MRKLRVYGWVGSRREAGPQLQTREICAARSQVEVARIAGQAGKPWRLWNLCETRNEEEVAVATASPGIIFWVPSVEQFRSNRRWRRGGTPNLP